MSEEGDRVRLRRERVGLDKKELAEAAGVSRDTLAAIEEGKGFRRSSLTKIERALTDAEIEAGLDVPTEVSVVPETDLIEVRVSPDGSFVVRGPVGDVGALVRSVTEIIRAQRHEADDDSET